MTLTLTSAIRRDDDVLEVRGTDSDGNEVIANGWISATTNYYPPSDYTTDEHGNLALVNGATPRKMTSDELRAYCQSVLDATIPPAPPASDPTITF